MPDFDAAYRDLVEPAFIRFEEHGSGEFAFGCVTGQISGGGSGNTVEFSWSGNDEMDDAQGEGWAKLQPNGSLEGKISFARGDEVDFIAQRWISSTAC
jgi:hypothetical protein